MNKIGPTHIQARLNPNESEEEQLALHEYYRRVEARHSPRRIVTDALLALAGYPIHVPEGLTADDIRSMMDRVKDDFAVIVSNLLNSQLEALAAMTPVQREQEIRRAVSGSSRSRFSSSVFDAIEIADYEEGDSE